MEQEPRGQRRRVSAQDRRRQIMALLLALIMVLSAVAFLGGVFWDGS